MQVDNKDIGVAAFVITQLCVIFGVGRTYGVLIKRVEILEESTTQFFEKVSVLDDEIEAQIDKRMLQLDLKISEIDERFITENGEPRYISYRAHDKMQAHCQNHLLTEMRHQREAVERMDKQLENLTGKFVAVLETLAVLNCRYEKQSTKEG